MSTLTVSQDFLAQSVHDALMLETFSPLPHFSCLYCDRDGQGERCIYSRRVRYFIAHTMHVAGNINEWSFVICFNDEGDGVKVTRRYSDAEVPLEDAAAPCEDLKTQGEEDLEKSELTRIRTPYVYECVRAKEPALADAAAATTGWSLMGGSIVAGPYRPCYHPYLAAETSKESAKETVSIAYVPRVKISEVRFYTWGYVQHIKSEGPAGSSVLACAITVHNVNRAQRFVRTQTEIRRRELEARRRGQQVGRTDTRRCDTETRRSETETRRRDTDTASPSLAPASPASTEATTIRVMLKRPPSDNFHLVVAADLSRVYLSCGGGIYSLPLAVVEVAPTESHTTSADAHGGCLDAQSPSREHGEGLHTSLNSVVHVELGRIKSLPGGPLTFDFQGDKLKSPGGICHIPCGAPLNAPIHTPGELASCTPNNGIPMHALCASTPVCKLKILCICLVQGSSHNQNWATCWRSRHHYWPIEFFVYTEIMRRTDLAKRVCMNRDHVACS